MSAHLIVSDEDSADFLQSQFSHDLRPFSVGQSTYGLWLDVKGKIVADSWVLCEGEAQFRIFSEECPGESIREKLEKHIIADDVELESGASVYGVALIGTGIGDAVAGAEGYLCRLPGRRSSRPSSELVFPDEASRDGWLSSNSCEIVSKSWIQEESIRAGVPAVMREVKPGDLPGEAGMVKDAVSLTKGCFLGQEVVARMHNVGRPQRGLYVLLGAGQAPVETAAVASGEGKVLGDLRSLIATADGWTGVAMLKSRFVECGMSVSVDGCVAQVQNEFRQGRGDDDA